MVQKSKIYSAKFSSNSKLTYNLQILQYRNLTTLQKCMQ